MPLDELLTLLEAQGPGEPRRRLRERLTVLSARAIPPAAWPLLERLWKEEVAQRPRVVARELPRLAASGWGARVSTWRGDITTLEIGAIVNAANSGLTGCYRPMHPCVDNAIHTAAGPWLRAECEDLMAMRGRPEPTSTATVTGGWFLPAKHVVHTVGPIVTHGLPTPHDEAALRRCYLECLLATAQLTPPGVAFCGISTGVFGYPAQLAVPLVVTTVREFLERDARVEHVVLVTFSDDDEALYASATREALHA